MQKALETVNPFLIRFKPDYRYRVDKTTEYSLNSTSGGFVSKDESITDKEAFAINFASERGDISAIGASRQGVYSIPSGKDYDPKNDFSYLNRPDITIVDLDSYIEQFKSQLEKADETLKSKIKDEIQTLQSKRDEVISQLEKGEKEKSE